MIIDTISSAKQYYSLHPMFEKAFEYILENINNIKEGRTDIDSDNLYVMGANGLLKNKEEAFLEAHNRYIDIQIVIKGNETFGWSSRKRCFSEQADYNSEKDIVFYNDTPSTYFTLTPDEFVIFFPEDSHAPLVGDGNIVKAVVKVKI